MSSHDDAGWVSFKVALAWVGLIVGSVTLTQWVMLATLIYTLANTFFLLRDKWWRDKK
jgi:hypothetical protein